MTLISSDLKQDFFSLFDLPARFELDTHVLEQRYRALQAEVHPDKVAHLPPPEQRRAMQRATQVNEAYQTLRDPLKRGRYLLHLAGVDTQEETNTAMPLDFLMQQMEWREALEQARTARDMTALTSLESHMQGLQRELLSQLAAALDGAQHAVAAALVRKLKFLEKFAEEITAAFDELDS